MATYSSAYSSPMGVRPYIELKVAAAKLPLKHRRGPVVAALLCRSSSGAWVEVSRTEAVSGAGREAPAWVESFEIAEDGSVRGRGSGESARDWRVEILCGGTSLGGGCFSAPEVLREGIFVMQIGGSGARQGRGARLDDRRWSTVSRSGSSSAGSRSSSASGGREADGAGWGRRGVVVLTAERVVPHRPAHLYAMHVRLGKGCGARGFGSGTGVFYVVYRAVRGGGGEFSPVYRSEVVAAVEGARFAPAAVRSERLIAGDENRKLRIEFFRTRGGSGEGGDGVAVGFVECSVGCFKHARKGGVLYVEGSGGRGEGGMVLKQGRVVFEEGRVEVETKGGALASGFALVAESFVWGRPSGAARRDRGADWVDVDDDGRHAAKLLAQRNSQQGNDHTLGRPIAEVPRGVSYMTARIEAMMEVKRTWAANRDARLEREREETATSSQPTGSVSGTASLGDEREVSAHQSPPTSPMSSASPESVYANDFGLSPPGPGALAPSPALGPTLGEDALVSAVRSRRRDLPRGEGRSPPRARSSRPTSADSLSVAQRNPNSEGARVGGLRKSVKELAGLFNSSENGDGSTVGEGSYLQFDAARSFASTVVPVDDESDNDDGFEYYTDGASLANHTVRRPVAQ